MDRAVPHDLNINRAIRRPSEHNESADIRLDLLPAYRRENFSDDPR